jgi:hypothetical protein
VSGYTPHQVCQTCDQTTTYIVARPVELEVILILIAIMVAYLLVMIVGPAFKRMTVGEDE